jgi:hypothetical protein
MPSFFFANYMNDVEEVPLNFLGVEHAGDEEKWIVAEVPKGHPDWNSGGTYRHINSEPFIILPFSHDKVK